MICIITYHNEKETNRISYKEKASYPIEKNGYGATVYCRIAYKDLPEMRKPKLSLCRRRGQKHPAHLLTTKLKERVKQFMFLWTW